MSTEIIFSTKQQPKLTVFGIRSKRDVGRRAATDLFENSDDEYVV